MTKSGQKPRASEVVFEELAMAILRGDVAPGGVLESERALATRFRTSRSTIREAVHKLGDASLVQVSQGAPTLILDPDRSVDLRVIALRYRLEGPREVRELGERRVLQGLTLVYLAALRASADELEPLLAAVDGCAARGAPAAELPALEKEVWVGIAALTRNRIFAREVAWWFGEGHVARPGEAEHPLGPAARVAFYRELLRRIRDRDRAAAYYLDVLGVILPE